GQSIVEEFLHARLRELLGESKYAKLTASQDKVFKKMREEAEAKAAEEARLERERKEAEDAETRRIAEEQERQRKVGTLISDYRSISFSDLEANFESHSIDLETSFSPSVIPVVRTGDGLAAFGNDRIVVNSGKESYEITYSSIAERALTAGL